MSTPLAKKRRTDAAANALSKPFKSPFKTAIAKDAADPNSASSPAPTTAHDSTASSLQQSKSSPAKRTFAPAPSPFGFRKSARSTPKSPSVNVPNTDPDMRPILKIQRELEATLRELKEELDTIQQARKIENDSLKHGLDAEIDGELKQLKEKWKTASRQAAEELFGGVKDRVNRMGGPRAWKEMQERQKEFQRGFDEEPPKNEDNESDDENGSGEKRDVYEYAGYDEAEQETANEREARGADEEEDVVDGDVSLRIGRCECAVLMSVQEFTMPMMLKSLNIDLALIGYDRDAQRWLN